MAAELEDENSNRTKGSEMDLAHLDRLTVQELRALIGDIDNAIRAAIRAKRAPQFADQAKIDVPVKIDLERERDAWLSAKR